MGVLLLEAVGGGYRRSGVMWLGECAWGWMWCWSGVKKLGSVK